MKRVLRALLLNVVGLGVAEARVRTWNPPPRRLMVRLGRIHEVRQVDGSPADLVASVRLQDVLSERHPSVSVCVRNFAVSGFVKQVGPLFDRWVQQHR